MNFEARNAHDECVVSVLGDPVLGHTTAANFVVHRMIRGGMMPDGAVWSLEITYHGPKPELVVGNAWATPDAG